MHETAAEGTFGPRSHKTLRGYQTKVERNGSVFESIKQRASLEFLEGLWVIKSAG